VERTPKRVTDDLATHRKMGSEMWTIGVEDRYLSALSAKRNEIPVKISQTLDLSGVQLVGIGHDIPAIRNTKGKSRHVGSRERLIEELSQNSERERSAGIAKTRRRIDPARLLA